jgi:hypothetical protein
MTYRQYYSYKINDKSLSNYYQIFLRGSSPNILET